ncbi:MAG: type III secretion system stator protein SctL [Deltaproteobacteria bacterium]|nr:type III secretion system stator protein SctL [Deltaproteobacteria bacterium]
MTIASPRDPRLHDSPRLGYGLRALPPKVIKGSVTRETVTPANRPPPPPMERGRWEKPIIDKEVVSAKQEASRIVREAEMQRQQLIEEAEQTADEIRENAFQQGLEEGKAQLTDEILRARAHYEKLKTEVEPAYIGLVRGCVEKILGQELHLHPDAVIGIVRNVLRDAAQQREIVVRVNPADQDTLKKHKGKLIDVLARAGNVELRADPGVSRGGCIVNTELGTIDATLERQLAVIESALKDELELAATDEGTDEAPAEDDPAEPAEGEDGDEEEGYEEE